MADIDIELKQLCSFVDLLCADSHTSAMDYRTDILYRQFKDLIEAEFSKYIAICMEHTLKKLTVEKLAFFLPKTNLFLNDFIDMEIQGYGR